MDEDEDGARGSIDDEGSGTGYESASDASTTYRRKMESSSDDEGKLQKKKMKKDKHTPKSKYEFEHDWTEKTDDNNDSDMNGHEKQNKKNEKDSNKSDNTKTKGSKKKKDANGFLDDGWIQNKIYKTFIMEPTDEKYKLHIMEIAKLLQNIKITQYKELKPAGHNRYKITFDNPRHAENLINSKILTETYKYKIYVPKMYQETIGVIRDVPPSFSDQEILEKLECKRIKITKVERIQKFVQNKLKPTYSVKIYAEGEKLPQEVVLYTVPRKVEVYCFPIKFCRKCLRYGHNLKVCKSEQTRCYNCSLNGHEGKDCKSLNIICFHCKEGHQTFDINCRERIRQADICKAMAYNKLSFDEAATLYPRQSQTQQRLQSLAEFPPIESQPTNNDTNKINEIPREIQTPTPDKAPAVNYKQALMTQDQRPETKEQKNDTNYITKDELTQIVNKLKIEIVKQLNLTKLINKIKEIQENIANNITNTNDSKKGTENKFLISISEQLNELINPEILQPTKPPNK